MFLGRERERPRVGGNGVCSENGETPGMAGAQKGRGGEDPTTLGLEPSLPWEQ